MLKKIIQYLGETDVYKFDKTYKGKFQVSIGFNDKKSSGRVRKHNPKSKRSFESQ